MARRQDPNEMGGPHNRRPIKTTMRALRIRRSRRTGNAGMRRLVQDIALDAPQWPRRGRKRKIDR